MPKKKPKTGKPKVHKDLEGFEINFNEFGELRSNMSVEQLNKFLNKNVDDKKLRDRDDIFEDEDDGWEEPKEEKEQGYDELEELPDDPNELKKGDE